MRSSFLPNCKPKITRISALPNKQGSQPKRNWLLTLTKKSPKKVLQSLFVWQGRIPCNFWFAFCEKRRPHKFILNLTDLQRQICYRVSTLEAGNYFLYLNLTKQKVSSYQKYIWEKEFSHLSNLLNVFFDFHIKMQLSLLTIKNPKTKI